MNTFRRNPFTLVEMLVVIALVALLFAIALPSFNRLIQGNSVDRVASLISTMLRQAQFQAVSARKTTALIIDLEGEDTEGIPSMRICHVTGNGPYTFEAYAADSRWVAFPVGAIVAYGKLTDDNPTEVVYTDDINTAEMPNNNTNIISPRKLDLSAIQSIKKIDNVSTFNSVGLVFSRYGALDGSTKAAKLMIAEGVLQGSNLVYTGGLDSNSKPENVIKISINPFTGKSVQLYSK